MKGKDSNFRQGIILAFVLTDYGKLQNQKILSMQTEKVTKLQQETST
jgi:hypothetical protein